MFSGFYKDKRVLVTGHTGFKGSWLSLWLSRLGAKVCGYSLAPDTTPNLFTTVDIVEKTEKSVIGSILDRKVLQQTFDDFQPEIVFHLAAQPLVRLSYAEPVLTYETNVIGSLNVLEAARKCGSVKAFVNVTTDKCYENRETGKNFEENDPFGGYDPYSSSKGCVEIMSASYRRSFLQSENSFAMATARAGNVIGGGDWALDRLVPDCIRAINKNGKIEIVLVDCEDSLEFLASEIIDLEVDFLLRNRRLEHASMQRFLQVVLGVNVGGCVGVNREAIELLRMIAADVMKISMEIQRTLFGIRFGRE